MRSRVRAPSSPPILSCRASETPSRLRTFEEKRLATSSGDNELPLVVDWHPTRGEKSVNREPVISRIEKPFLAALVTAMLAFAASAPIIARAETNLEQVRMDRATRVFREIMDAPDQDIPSDLLGRSECVVVIPSMKKAGFIFGGRYGKGVVSCRKAQGMGPWGPPSMITLGGGSFGLQIGAAAVDVVMLVMNPSGIDRLLQDKFTLGG